MLLEAAEGMPRGINDGQQRLITFLAALMAAVSRHSFADEKPRAQARESHRAPHTLQPARSHERSHLGDAIRIRQSRIRSPGGTTKEDTAISFVVDDIGSNGLLDLRPGTRIKRLHRNAMDKQPEREAFFRLPDNAGWKSRF